MNEATATKNTAEILRAAAQRVREGWHQGYYVSYSGDGVCAIGAICVASGAQIVGGLIGAADLPRAFIRAIEDSKAVAHVVRVLGLGDDGGIPAWNDDDEQTAENVALGLEYAALVWEEERNADVQAAGSQSAASPDGQTCILSERR